MATMDKAALNICVCISVWMYVFIPLGCVPGGGIAGSHGTCVCNERIEEPSDFPQWLPHFIFPPATLSHWILPHSGPVSSGEWRARLAPHLHVYVGSLLTTLQMRRRVGRATQAKARDVGIFANASASLHSFYTHGMCANLASTSPPHEESTFLGNFLFRGFLFSQLKVPPFTHSIETTEARGTAHV